uniref:Uncharacterized protein n=1 Tax=Plectus sambesii TaxID=2011161 RepID=A0A914WKM3_9BILA
MTDVSAGIKTLLGRRLIPYREQHTQTNDSFVEKGIPERYFRNPDSLVTLRAKSDVWLSSRDQLLLLIRDYSVVVISTQRSTYPTLSVTPGRQALEWVIGNIKRDYEEVIGLPDKLTNELRRSLDDMHAHESSRT